MPMIGIGEPVARRRRAPRHARRRCSCSTAATRSACSPAPTCWRSSPPARPDERTCPRTGFETRAIHAGQEPDPATGAVVPPITSRRRSPRTRSASTTASSTAAPATRPAVALEDVPRVARRRAPRARVRERPGRRGRGAAHARSAGRPRDHPRRRVRRHVPARRRACTDRPGVEWSAVDLTRSSTRCAHGAAPTRPTVVWIETRRTRCSTVVDIAAVAEVAHARDAARRRRQHVRDAVPPAAARARRRRRRALDHEVPRRALRRRRRLRRGRTTTSSPSAIAFLQNAVGAVPSPFDCYLVLRGIKTLAVRMDRHCENARAVAEMLDGHPAVARVLYPGLPDAPRPRGRRAGRCATSAAWCRSSLAGGEDAALELVARDRGCSRWPSRSARSSR